MDGGKNIKVIARFRPENELEKGNGSERVVQFEDQTTCRLQTKDFTGEFVFDRVFDTECTQQDVFEYSLKPTVDDVMNGYNGTVFAYGQTGSGKSYTMMGPDIEDAQKRGAIPRIVDQIFDKIVQSPADIEYMVRVSYMEIYMERIRDLLSPQNDNLAIHEDKTRGIHVKNLTEEYVTSAEEVFQVMRQGSRLRAVASTNMNQESSRSHSIFMVVVSQKNLETGSQKTGQLFLVDLAGSEKVGKTGASGQTLEEAKKINKSLSALGNVINSLTDGKSTHIPYRDSKLTRILQESLGGNSRTSLIVNCSPASYNQVETVSTLRFGVRAKTIRNKARVNTELSPAELRALLKKCQSQLDDKVAYAKKLEAELRDLKGELLSSAENSPRSGTPIKAFRGESPVRGGLGFGSPTMDDEYMRRENELQDQIAEQDYVLQQQEKEIEQLKSESGVQLERLKYQNQDLQVKMEAMASENERLRMELSQQQLVQAPPSPTPDEAPSPRPKSMEFRKRKMTADILGEFYQKSQADLIDDALSALGKLSGENQEAVLTQIRGSLESMQRMPEYRHERIMEADRASFRTLVDEYQEESKDSLYDAKIRAHEDTIVKLMKQIDELTTQNNDLHVRLQTTPTQFEKVKQSLMRDLQDRCEKVVELEISLDQARDQYNYAIKNGHNKSQQKKMAMLERNLEQLMNVQQQLQQQNTQLKKEAAVAAKLLSSRNDRIGELELTLHENRQRLAREQEQFEIQLAYLNERIQHVRTVSGSSSKIVRPMRGGGITHSTPSTIQRPPPAAQHSPNRNSVWNKINSSASTLTNSTN